MICVESTRNFLNSEGLQVWRETGLTPRQLLEQRNELLAALQEICNCPHFPDPATIPKGGIEVAPQQVILNFSLGLVRLQKAQAAIAKAASTSEATEFDREYVRARAGLASLMGDVEDAAKWRERATE